MQRRHLAPLVGVAALLAAYGCAGSGHSPLAPGTTLTPEPGTGPGTPFGHYQLHVDDDTATLTAVHSGQAFADSRSYDATEFFTSAPCADCVRIDSIRVTPEGKIAVDIGIRHPFTDTENRKDLDAFDVRGILGVDGVVTFPNTPGLLGHPLTTDPAVLLNADGYTTHYFEVLDKGDATLNPFRRFFIDDEGSATGDGEFNLWYRMPMGSEWDVKRYILEPSHGPVTYDFVIEVSYGQSARSPFNGTPADDPGGWNNPQYWNPEFNQKEAFATRLRVDAAPASNTPGVLKLSADTTDWQMGLVVDESFPNPENPFGLMASSNIVGTALEIPGLNVTTDTPTTEEGTGAAGDPLTMTWDLNLPASITGKYPVLFTVVDELYDPDTLEQSYEDYRAFQVAQIRIQPGGVVGEIPVAILASTPDPATSFLREATFQFVGANSFDPDLVDLNSFAFDFNYDGGVFQPDFTADTPDEAIPFHTYDEPGDYTVALRVGNADGEISDIVSLPVHVMPDPIVPSPEVEWQNGVNISPDLSLPSLGTASDSAIAYGPDGTVHVVYMVEEEGIFLGSDIYVYHVAIPPSGTPTTPEEISHEVVLENFRAQSAVAIGPNNVLHVVFSLQDEINYTKKSGSTWSEPFAVAAADGFGGESLGFYDLAVSSGNQIGLIYETFYPTDELPAKVYMVFNTAGTWSVEDTIGTGWGVSLETRGTVWPTITRNGAGFVAAWAGGPTAGTYQQDVYVRRYTAGTWAPKETVAADPGLGEIEPNVAVGADGTIAVAYRTGSGILATIARNGGTFGNAVSLFPNAAGRTHTAPVMVAGNNGALACVCLEKDGVADPGTIVTLAFSKDHSDPSYFGLMTRGLAANTGPVYLNPDAAGNGTTGLSLVAELQQPGWVQLRFIRGQFQMP